MTGNIIVSTCCLGDMPPRPRAAPSDTGAFTAISPSQTCANYYVVVISIVTMNINYYNVYSVIRIQLCTWTSNLQSTVH